MKETQVKKTEVNPAKLRNTTGQRWKKSKGLCLVAGCSNPATKGHFCNSCASKRTKLKAKGVTLDQPIDFKPKAKPKAVKVKQPETKAVKAAPKAAKVPEQLELPIKNLKKVATPKVKQPKAAKDPKVTLVDPAQMELPLAQTQDTDLL
jgi:hypothetical protein